MKSIIQTEKECFFTGETYDLHKHHIFFGNPGRKLSEKYGLTVYLVPYWHTTGPQAVHNCRKTDLILKQAAQKAFERVHGTREDFMKIFGRNYL